MGWNFDISEYNNELSIAESIYKEALGLFDNNELAAVAHVHLCQWKNAVEKYPDTYAAKYVSMVCDNLCNYSISHTIRVRYDW